MAQAANPTLWQRLVAPHPSITDVERRRQSRLLSAFLILSAVVFGLAGVWNALNLSRLAENRQAAAAALFFGGGCALVLYVFSRAGKYNLSAYGFIIILFVLIHTSLLPSNSLPVNGMYIMLHVLLMSSILLTLRATIILSVASLGIQLFFVIFAPKVSLAPTSGPFLLSLLFVPLILVFLQHRSALEHERQAKLEEANTALRESEASLEKRVAARTRDLEIAADVSKQITTILDLQELLQAVVERTKASFNLYHVSIFLVDADSQSLTLTAGAGKVGEVMQSEGWKFSLQTDRGLVPEAARTQAEVLINDVVHEARYQANRHLPYTRSELALPMVVGARLVGILDVQSELLDRFSLDDIRVMKSLAEQIAIAVDNARLYAAQVDVAKKLREVDNIKSQFLASMSHELRTPLNAILNFTEFVAVGILGPVNEEQVDALNKALDSSRHLLNLINDVLDVTKIEAGMMTLYVEDNIDLNHELKPIIATAQTLLADKPVTFVQDIDRNLPTIVGDRRRIRQILLNLISNAAKFTDEGSITLSVKNQGQQVLFTVSDTGPGIAPQDQAIIFEPFIQTETGIQHAGGTGLGLPISKRLAEAHGGSLEVESIVGQGSAFCVRLPIRSAALVHTMEKMVEEVQV